MPATSKAQHGFMGLVHSVKSGQKKIEDVRPGVQKKVAAAAKSMTLEQVKDYTRTKTGPLPERARSREAAPRNARSA